MTDLVPIRRPGLLTRAAQAARYVISGVDNAWMSPQQPLPPVAPPDVKGRLWDYPVALNLQYVPRSNEPPAFERLAALGNSDLFRTIAERKKDVIESFEWQIKPKEVEEGQRPPESEYLPAIKKISAKLARPDNVYDWGQWLRGFLDQVYIFDALSIYPRQTRGGDIYGFEIMAGENIKCLIDATGRRPLPPDPSYQQRLKGIPAADYTSEELIYYPRNIRPGKLYGYPPAQMVINYIDTAIERLKSQKAYFTQGNIPDGFFTGPVEWTIDNIASMQKFWDSMFSGNVEQRRHAWWVPAGTTWKELKAAPLKDEFDDWLVRVICFALSTSPTAFIKQNNRATAENQQEVAEEGGAAADLAFIKRVIDYIIQNPLYFNQPDLEFVWSTDREFDPFVNAQIDKIDVGNALRTPNEVRDAKGLDAVEGGDELIFITAGGVTTLKQALDAADRAIAMPVGAPAAPGAPPPGNGVGGDVEEHPPTATGKPSVTAANARTQAAKKLYLAALASDDALEKALGLDVPLPKQRAAATRFRAQVTAALATAGHAISRKVASALSARKLAKDDRPSDEAIAAIVAQIMSDIDLDGFIDIDPLDLQEVVQAAADHGLATLGVELPTDLVNQVNDRAAAYAKERAAELVALQGEDNIVQATRNAIRNVIGDGLAENIGIPAITKGIEESVAFSPERAAIIANTEVRRANGQGALTGYRAARDAGVTVTKLWSTASENVCPICEANEDQGAIDLDDDFISGDDAPPAHPDCFHPGTEVAGVFLVAASAPYEGPMREIIGRSGARLSVTPNHPVFTDLGLKPAAALKVGDNLVRYAIEREGLSADDQHEPTRAEQVFHALRVTGAVASIEAAPHDFHGDALGFKGNVEIVALEGELLSANPAANGEPDREDVFVLSDVGAPGLVGESASTKLATAGARSASRRVSASNLIGLGRVVHAGPFQALGVGSAAYLDAMLSEPPKESWPRQSSIVSDALQRLAGDVATDEIVEIRDFDFSGHVIDLQTSTGYLLAGGVLVSNCRCSLVPITTDEDTGEETESDDDLELVAKYSDDQPRDEHGRWAGGGSDATSGGKVSAGAREALGDKGIADLRDAIARGAPSSEIVAKMAPAYAAASAINQAPTIDINRPPEEQAAQLAGRTYGTDANGNTIDAAGMHDKLVGVAMDYAGKEGVAAEGKATIILGPPAAGKSDIAEKMAVSTRSAIVDGDDAKKEIPEWAGGAGASKTQEESSMLAKAVQSDLMATNANMILPLVGAKASSIQDRVDALHGAGYTVNVVNMDVNSDEAMRRMASRYISTGRLIDSAYATDVDGKPTMTYNALKSSADGWASIDNNGPRGSAHATESSGTHEGLLNGLR